MPDSQPVSLSEHSAERSEVGYITQGLPPRRVVVNACCNEGGLWVEIRRHHGKPWEMTPELARGLAELLREAANKADAMSRKYA